MAKIFKGKSVCFECRKAFERPWKETEVTATCPNCGGETLRYDKRFRPPKKTNLRQWRKVEFLRDHGFYFQKVYESIEPGVYRRVCYPKDIIAAREFVKTHKLLAINTSVHDWVKDNSQAHSEKPLISIRGVSEGETVSGKPSAK